MAFFDGWNWMNYMGCFLMISGLIIVFLGVECDGKIPPIGLGAGLVIFIFGLVLEMWGMLFPLFRKGYF